LPEPASVDVEARVVALVQSHRPQLAELVRQAVDRELQALVQAELEHRANGNGNGAQAARTASALCAPCGERTRMKGRTVCSRCKVREEWRRARERQTAAAPEEPPPEVDRTIALARVGA
jgi:hypothetical protein